MTEAYQCDKCGTTMKPRETETLEVRRVPYHLCPYCYGKFKEWMGVDEFPDGW